MEANHGHTPAMLGSGHRVLWNAAVVFTHATLCIARSLRQQRVCLSVCYSRYCIKTETASIMISSPSDSPKISLSGEVWRVEKFTRGSPPARAICESGVAFFCDFWTYKVPYLRNGARYDQSYYWTLIGNRTRAFDWYQDQRPWMTLNWPWAAITRFLRYTSVFRSPPRKYKWT